MLFCAYLVFIYLIYICSYIILVILSNVFVGQRTIDGYAVSLYY